MSKLLIVEDDRTVSEIYSNLSHKNGFEVLVARDGEEALECLRQHHPDIVLLDLLIPKVNGIEVLKQIRASPATRSLPVIALSNDYLGNTSRQATQAGASHCLSKSNCSADMVMDVIRSTLAKPSPSPEAGSFGTSVAFPERDEVLAGMREAERNYKANIRRQFLENTVARGGALRSLLHAFVKEPDATTRLNHLQQLYTEIRSLTCNAGTVGLPHLAQFASAFEALLKDLCEHPSQITASVQNTLVRTVDFLLSVLPRADLLDAGTPADPRILVVDDDPLCTRRVKAALAQANLPAVEVNSAVSALAMLSKDPYDLVFMDISMPSIDGIEACRRLHAFPHHKKTPVIFVTSHGDFESRAKTIMSGGVDLISKPFVSMELAVKALMRLWEVRLAAAPPA